MRALLVDLDGTLANSLFVMKIAYQHFLNQLNRKPTLSEFNLLNGPPLTDIVHYLKLAHSLQEEEALLRVRYTNIINSLYADVEPMKGACHLIHAAKKHSYVIGVVTSNSRLRTQTWLKRVELLNLINFIVTSDDVKYGKPHPQPYMLAITQSVCQLNDIIAIEDSFQGARSAVDAGLRTFVLSDNRKKNNWPDNIEIISSLDDIAIQLFK